MTKSLKTLRMTRLKWRVLLQALPEQGGWLAINTSFARFRNSWVWNACTFASFRKYCFAEILNVSQVFTLEIWFRRLSQTSTHFRKYGFTVFRNISQGFAIYSFAKFHKVSQGFANWLSQGFASAEIMVFRKVSQWGLCYSSLSSEPCTCCTSLASSWKSTLLSIRVSVSVLWYCPLPSCVQGAWSHVLTLLKVQECIMLRNWQ